MQKEKRFNTAHQPVARPPGCLWPIPARPGVPDRSRALGWQTMMFEVFDRAAILTLTSYTDLPGDVNKPYADLEEFVTKSLLLHDEYLKIV
jgi:hypothetical protein